MYKLPKLPKPQFKDRSTEKEWLDKLEEMHISKELLIQNLQEFEVINSLLGSKKILLRCLDEIFTLNFPPGECRIADLGCGAGDLTAAMASWAEINSNLLHEKNIGPVQVLGLDNHPVILDYARQRKQDNASGVIIRYQNLDIFSNAFKQNRFDIVCLNNVCHHFTQAELTILLQQLKNQVKIAIVINDLHRHPIAYYAIKTLTKIFNFSKIACFDGPLSVLRAFRHQDLVMLMKTINAQHYQLRWIWPFRWQLIIWCTGATHDNTNE